MKVNSERFAKVWNDTTTFPFIEHVATHFGASVTEVKNRAASIRERFARGEAVPNLILRFKSEGKDKVVIEAIPTAEEPLKELLNRAFSYNDKQIEFAERRKLIDIGIDTDGPFGVAGLPDQHLNNTGTWLRKAFSDAHLINNTEGLYCVAVGDWLDNFILGRLERERRKDKMSHSDGNRIQEAYLSLVAPKLLAAIGGNHNDWVEWGGGEDVLGTLMKRLNRGGVYHPDEVRVRINTPKGHNFIHLVRHIFPGHSKYNTAHGVLAWILDRWQGEDVFWGGHIHAAGHVTVEREHLGESKVVYGVQLPSYKVLDGYATKRGFRKNQPFICPMVIHDPRDGSTQFFDDIVKGTTYLTFLRSRK